MEMKETGCDITWEALPDKDMRKADLLCRLERAGHELQMGLEWDDTGLKNAAIEEMEEVLEEIRNNLTIQIEGKDKRIKAAEKDLHAFARNMDSQKAAGEFENFYDQILEILSQW